MQTNNIEHNFLFQRESLENVNTSLRILTVLAEDCPEETLLRYVGYDE